jgi:benzoyl-CoA reductase/2-hydroxyglutaryl-CoA dehydratase subunit BcrC/BadD/HgdB
MERVPWPSVLVYNTNQCREVKDWFSWYARRLGVPVLGIHSPVELDAVGPEAVDYVSSQLQRLAKDLAPLAPRVLDPEALREAMAASREASILWGRCLTMAAARPSPWNFFDHTIHMGPIVVMRGTSKAVDYYRDLLEELEVREAEGQAAIPGERFRVYWDGMPIWGRLRSLSELFQGLGTSLVASTYCNSWVLDGQDPDDPWRSMARTYLSIFICRSESFKEAYILRMVSEFGAGGIIFHDSKTCPHNTNSRYGMPSRIKESSGLPVLVLEGDLNDPRCFAFEESRTRIEIFLEQMEGVGA